MYLKIYGRFKILNLAGPHRQARKYIKNKTEGASTLVS